MSSEVQRISIPFPTCWTVYFGLLTGRDVYPSEERAVQGVFDKGLDEAMWDADQTGGELGIDQTLLDRPSTEIALHLDAEQKAVLEALSSQTQIGVARLAGLCLLMGLADAWIGLRSMKAYDEDQDFRKAVDEMPHVPVDEVGFEEPDGEDE